MRVQRPWLSKLHVALACGHVTLRPLSKTMPERMRCTGCAEGRPTDPAFVEGAIEDATEEQAAVYLARLEARLRGGPASGTGALVGLRLAQEASL